jgi:hypothetical protein
LKEVRKILFDAGKTEIAENLTEGFQLCLATIKIAKAAERIKLPKGVEISSYVFTNKTDDAAGIVRAANWIMNGAIEGAENLLSAFPDWKWKDGEPCDHPGCLHHVSHPCEGCGRIGGFPVVRKTPEEILYEGFKKCYPKWIAEGLLRKPDGTSIQMKSSETLFWFGKEIEEKFNDLIAPITRVWTNYRVVGLTLGSENITENSIRFPVIIQASRKPEVKPV